MFSSLTRAAARPPRMLLRTGTNTSSVAPIYRSRSLRASSTASSSPSSSNNKGRGILKKFAKGDPELYPLYFIMAGIIGFAGYYFAGHPTTSTDARSVPKVPGSEPWRSKTDDGGKAAGRGKYKYYPHGDDRAEPREAPSALNTVIVPNVTLPKHLHEKYNKYGKPEWDF